MYVSGIMTPEAICFFSDISVCIFGSGNKLSYNCSRSGSVILLKRSRSGLGCFNLSLSGSGNYFYLQVTIFI